MLLITGQCWSLLVSIGQYWSVLVGIGRYWSVLFSIIHWSVLVSIGHSTGVQRGSAALKRVEPNRPAVNPAPQYCQRQHVQHRARSNTFNV